MPTRLASDLLAWYAKNQRQLPWRRTRDPYAIWVSEVMLQQTRVETVVPYYRRWLRRFPTVERLARARSGSVAAAWEGLGSYRPALQRLPAAIGGECHPAGPTWRSIRARRRGRSACCDGRGATSHQAKPPLSIRR